MLGMRDIIKDVYAIRGKYVIYITLNLEIVL